MPTPARQPSASKLEINRAPVLTLWAAIVAERLGFDADEALTLGRALAGLNAQSKGRRLGIFAPKSPTEAKKHTRAMKPGESVFVELMGRGISAVRTADGLRAVEKGERPADPKTASRYLESKFGDSLADARAAMQALAKSLPPAKLAESGFALYEEFRPKIPAGRTGWGAKGVLDLELIRSLARN